MKLRHQLAFSAFAVFALIFSGSGLTLIEISARLRQQDQIDALIAQNRAIDGMLSSAAALMAFTPSSSSPQRQLQNQLEKILADSALETGVRILDEEGRIMADSGFPEIDDNQMETPQNDQIWMKIKNTAAGPILISAHALPLNDTRLIIQSSADLRALRRDVQNQLGLFFFINLAACAVYWLAMIVVSRRLTQPIEQLAEGERQIAGGRWSQRVPVSGAQELKALAENFNRMAETVEQKVAELETGNQEKEIFINNLSHEMKTPLTSILGYTQLLRRTKMSPQDAEQALDIIESEARRMERLSSRLMQLIIAARPLSECSAAALDSFIEQAVLRLKPALREKSLRLCVECELLTVLIDEELMQAALRNVLDNAVKASQPQTLITIEAKTTETGWQIAVRDEGCGIQDPHPERMLQPFVMEDQARSRKHHGAGLGLALTQRIVQAHGGTVEIDSQPGHGTEVRFVFPPETLAADAKAEASQTKARTGKSEQDKEKTHEEQ